MVSNPQAATALPAELAPEQAARRRWMGVLARTPLSVLEAVRATRGDLPDHVFLRAPEVGSALVRARAGGTGGRFNMGEITLTRCALRLADGTVGLSHVAGRDRRHAELAALFDALLQTADHHDALEADLIAPQEAAQAAAKRERSAKAAASKVDFFTLVRGE
jgi:alpha-D-ribose 1-methylphosphonate 5-triphosphate synthase subunit PhnG